MSPNRSQLNCLRLNRLRSNHLRLRLNHLGLNRLQLNRIQSNRLRLNHSRLNRLQLDHLRLNHKHVPTAYSQLLTVESLTAELLKVESRSNRLRCYADRLCDCVLLGHRIMYIIYIEVSIPVTGPTWAILLFRYRHVACPICNSSTCTHACACIIIRDIVYNFWNSDPAKSAHDSL